jgi:hypothetical protein
MKSNLNSIKPERQIVQSRGSAESNLLAELNKLFSRSRGSVREEGRKEGRKEGKN